MQLKTYISNPTRRRALLDDVPISAGYLRQIANRWRGRSPSPGMARMIAKATGGRVSRHELRPDIFDKVKSRRKRA